MRNQTTFVVPLAFVTFALVGVPRATEWQDPSPHGVSFLGIEQGVALEVLDWGGSGPPLILLAGLGNTAHVFDEFALRFTDHFHVYGITRRGYGASSRPSDGYDIETLAHDIRVVCDRLNLERVILVGHSIAGEELTKFASTYPSRVRALVYLDAAYDRTGPPFTAPYPKRPEPTPDDLASAANLNDYRTRLSGVRLPEAEIRWEMVADGSGRYLRDSTPGEVPEAIRRRVERPDYAHVQAPALAIYQANDARFAFPNYASFSTVDKALADAVIEENEPAMAHSMEQVRREIAHGRVVRLTTGSHYLFITNDDEVVRLLQDFLVGLPSS